MKLKFCISTIILLNFNFGWADPLKMNLNEPIFGSSMATGFITVPCNLNNKPTDCFIDTGAKRSFAKYDEFKDFTIVGEEVGGGAHGKEESINLVEINNFELSEINLKQHIFAITPNGIVSRFNLIGNDIFKNQVLNFNFDQKELSFSYPNADFDQYDLNLYNKTWVGMDVQLLNKNIVAIWDSGASFTAISNEFVINNETKLKKIGETDVEDASGVLKKANIYQADIKIKSKTFKNIQFVVIDFSTIKEKIDKDVDMIIGFNLYTQANWLLDYENLTWGFWN